MMGRTLSVLVVGLVLALPLGAQVTVGGMAGLNVTTHTSSDLDLAHIALTERSSAVLPSIYAGPCIESVAVDMLPLESNAVITRWIGRGNREWRRRSATDRRTKNPDRAVEGLCQRLL